MMRGPGATALLGRALTASAARAGAHIAIARDEATAWHSATFTGARHAFEITAPACGLIADWLATIGDADLPLAGHLLADLSVTHRAEQAGTLHLRIEALTVAAA
jgi:hypothetical protein